LPFANHKGLFFQVSHKKTSFFSIEVIAKPARNALVLQLPRLI
jgi:hypothetical protein